MAILFWQKVVFPVNIAFSSKGHFFFSESVGALEEYSSPEPNLRLDAFMSYKIELLLLFQFVEFLYFLCHIIFQSAYQQIWGAINTLEQWPCSFLEYTCLECILNICTYSWLLQWYSPLLATNFPILDCHIHLKRNSNVLMDLVPRRKMLCQLCYSNKVLLL